MSVTVHNITIYELPMKHFNVSSLTVNNISEKKIKLLAGLIRLDKLNKYIKKECQLFHVNSN